MNKQEAVRLLALIKVAYPTAYRDLDESSKKATVNMWAMSFPQVPYPIMEQAFNQFRMVSKYPPTVAEMAQQLRKIHFQAAENALLQKNLGNEQLCSRFLQIVACTKGYQMEAQTGPLALGEGRMTDEQV